MLSSPTGVTLPPRRAALLIGAGWIGTGLSLGLADLPLKFLLKDGLGLSAAALAGFLAIANIPIYIKPFAGILSDAVPLFGTRRRSYLLGSLLLGGLGWLLLGLVPHGYGSLLATYLFLNLFLVMSSTVLGGLMVEVGQQQGSTGRLSAQRVGIVRWNGLVTSQAGGRLARMPFVIAMSICAFFHLALVPLFWSTLREARSNRIASEVLDQVARQLRALVASRTLWAAAGLVVLVIASPGFNVPLLYFQTDRLGFTSDYIGTLGVVQGSGGILGAVIYGLLCRRFSLRRVLAGSIVVHVAGALCFLGYRSPVTAIFIHGVYGMTDVLAVLPLYDLAARATPRGSEALGYSLMMSVWNFTHSMSDVAGSRLYDWFGKAFDPLVWINAGTTALVLLVVPFLPAILVDRREGERRGGPLRSGAGPDPNGRDRGSAGGHGEAPRGEA